MDNLNVYRCIFNALVQHQSLLYDPLHRIYRARSHRQSVLRREIYLQGRNPELGELFFYSFSRIFNCYIDEQGYAFINFQDAYLNESITLRLDWIEEVIVGAGPDTQLYLCEIAPNPRVYPVGIIYRRDRQEAHLRYWIETWGDQEELLPLEALP